MLMLSNNILVYKFPFGGKFPESIVCAKVERVFLNIELRIWCYLELHFFVLMCLYLSFDLVEFNENLLRESGNFKGSVKTCFFFELFNFFHEQSNSLLRFVLVIHMQIIKFTLRLLERFMFLLTLCACILEHAFCIKEKQQHISIHKYLLIIETFIQKISHFLTECHIIQLAL